VFLLRISSNGAHYQVIFRVFLQKEAVREKIKNAKPKKPIILNFLGRKRRYRRRRRRAKS
jgi:hypothetical protein